MAKSKVTKGRTGTKILGRGKKVGAVVEIDGADRLIKVLEDMDQQAQDELANLLNKGAQRTLEMSRMEVPRDTDALLNSGKVLDASFGDKPLFFVQYGGESEGKNGSVYVDYALYVEEGTTKMDAQPYLGPAFEEASVWVVGQAKKVINDAIKRSV